MARSVEFDQDLAVRQAMEVFWKKGYKAASLRDLTEAMHLNPSSLYNTLGDKHELFVRCVQRYVDDRREYLEQHTAANRSPLDTLRLFLDDAVASITSSPYSCMAIKAAFEVGADDPRVQAILKHDNDLTYRFLCDLLTRAMKQGQIRADEDPALVTDFLLNTYSGWHESFILHQDPEKIRKMGHYLLRQLTR